MDSISLSSFGEMLKTLRKRQRMKRQQQPEDFRGTCEEFEKGVAEEK